MGWVIIGVMAAALLFIGSIMGMTAHGRITLLEQSVKSLRRELLDYTPTSTPKRSANDGPNKAQTPQKAAALTSNPPKRTTPKELEKTSADWGTKTTKPKSPAPKPVKATTPKPETPKKPRKSFEEALGAQWSVWVGGLALLLGAVFLLRYSIEAGFFSPAMRVAMAALLGVVLLAASEWLHRADLKSPNTNKAASLLAENVRNIAHIPGVLAAAGMFALLGATYAAYELYGFLNAIPAFMLLGVLSLGALALSLRHGPILAALGLAASLATPLLVDTSEPNLYALYGYIIIIAASAITVARLRDWGWLTLLTLTSLLGWSSLSFDAVKSADTLPVWFGFLGLGFAATVWLATKSPAKPATKDLKKTTDLPDLQHLDLQHTARTALIWGGVAALFVVAAIFSAEQTRLIYVLSLLAACAYFVAAWFVPRQGGHVIFGAVVGAFAVWAGLEIQTIGIYEIISVGAVLTIIVTYMTMRQVFKAEGGLLQEARAVLFPMLAVAYPIGLFGIMSSGGRISYDQTAIIFFVCAIANAALAFWLRGKPNMKVPAGIFAVGAAIAYVLASALAFDGMSLTLALLVGLVIATAAAWKFGDRTLRILVPIFAGLSTWHTLLAQIPEKDSVGPQAIFNELWIYFALPAVLCAGAAWLLQKRKSDLWSEGLKAFALAFGALFIAFQIRHLMNGGDILAARFSFDELSLQVLTGFCFTLGGAIIGQHNIDPKADLDRNLLPAIMLGVSLFSLAAFVFGVCLGKAPLFNQFETITGNIALNSLVLGYLLPTLIFGAVAWLGRNNRPQWYLRIVSALAGVAGLLYVTSMIRFGFSGPQISLFKNFPEGAELYAISAAWLLLGIGLLVIGMKYKRQDVRLASAILITLTVLKAFLIDMAELEGVLRAMSFVVLGLVLIVIGRAYQKLLAKPEAAN